MASTHALLRVEVELQRGTMSSSRCTSGTPSVSKNNSFRQTHQHVYVPSRRLPCVRVVAAAQPAGQSKSSSVAGSKKSKAVQLESETTTASIGQPSRAPPAPPQYPGTPLFWVGVGVALSVFVNWASKKIYQQAQQAMMRQMMEAMKSGGMPGGMPGGASPFGSPPPFGGAPGASPFGGAGASPFGGMPFPMPPPPSTAAGPSGSSNPFAPPPPPQTPSPSKPVVDVTSSTTVSSANGTATPKMTSPQSSTSSSSSTRSQTESAAAPSTPTATPSSVIEEGEEAPKPRKSFFQDADVTDASQGTSTSSDGGYTWASAGASSASSPFSGAAPGKGKMTVEALEKMLEDPTIQKMILPYLPEEMRDPATFKWMMQSPLYRGQLEQMLEGGAGQGFDPRVVEMMSNFDLNSSEVQDQFAQLGMTPEQVVSKIMSDPKLANAFQNPRIQAAILDVSTNPYNLAKYANDAEFMEVFQKMQQVFPGQ